MHSATKRRIEALEAQARAETHEVRIAWIDENGVIVGYTTLAPIERRNAHETPYVDYREIFRGGIYADYEKQT